MLWWPVQLTPAQWRGVCKSCPPVPSTFDQSICSLRTFRLLIFSQPLDGLYPSFTTTKRALPRFVAPSWLLYCRDCEIFFACQRSFRCVLAFYTASAGVTDVALVPPFAIRSRSWYLTWFHSTPMQLQLCTGLLHRQRGCCYVSLCQMSAHPENARPVSFGHDIYFLNSASGSPRDFVPISYGCLP